ncbi:hypothetical protein VRRI112168_07225 [Vreelandella rituensis]
MVAVAITALQQGAVAPGNPLDRALFGLNIETAGLANRHAPRVAAGLLAGRDNRPDPIAGLKALRLWMFLAQDLRCVIAVSASNND